MLGAFVSALDYLIAGVVDHLSVDAFAAHQSIGAKHAVQLVVVVVVGHDVIEAVAGPGEVRIAGIGQVSKLLESDPQRGRGSRAMS